MALPFFGIGGCTALERVQAQSRSSRRMVGGVNSCLESNPIPTRDTQRAQTNLVCARTQEPHRDGDRTVFECLLRRQGSAVECFRGRGSGCSRPAYGISPLGGGCHYPTTELPELTRDWEIESWRAQTESCGHQDPGERSNDPRRD